MLKLHIYYVSYAYTMPDKPDKQKYGGGEIQLTELIINSPQIMTIAARISNEGGFKTIAVLNYIYMREESVDVLGTAQQN